MKTIWKFPLNPGPCLLKMPKDAQFLSVQTQHEQPQMWFLVDPQAEPVHRTFQIRGTGWEFTPEPNEQFLGTFQLSGGALVFHAFEILAQ